MMFLQPGEIIHNRYEVKEIIGQGAFGAVYRVADLSLSGREWALKELSAEKEDEEEFRTAVNTFETEVKMLSSITCDGIPDISDYFTIGKKAYIVLELINGSNLEEHLAKFPPPFKEDLIINYTKQICSILKVLHNQNPPVIFRDLKPTNIMVDEKNHLTLIDFGIARVFKQEQTTDTIHIGTPGYAPPEQFQGGKTDQRTDLYSLGMLMHYLATGKDPLQSSSFTRQKPKELNPLISDKLSAIITKLTETDKELRFQSADELLDALNSPESATELPRLSEEQKEALIEKDRKKTSKNHKKVKELVLAGILAILLIYFGASELSKRREKDYAYYKKNPNDFFVVSIDPPSGIPVSTKVDKVVIKFNHPVDYNTLKENTDLDTSSKFFISSSMLTDNNTTLTIPLKNNYCYFVPDVFTFLNGLKDNRGNRINGYVSYCLRREDFMKRKYALLNNLDPHHDQVLKDAENPPISEQGKDAMDIVLRRMYHLEESCKRYPIMPGQSKSYIENHPFPSFSMYKGGGGKWNIRDAAGKKTLLLVQTIDGRIVDPSPEDMMKVIRTFYKPENLNIVVCCISTDKEPIDGHQKNLGSGFTVVSDLQGCRGNAFHYLVNSKTMLPLIFIIDEKGTIRYGYTGFPCIDKLVEGCYLAGLKPDLPNPQEQEIKAIQDKINANPNDYNNYLEMGKLYEKAGNQYMALLYNYHAYIYGYRDKAFRRDIYNNFMNWGMNLEAYDVSGECHKKNKADEEQFYLAAEAVGRMRHPNQWYKPAEYLYYLNTCFHLGTFNGKAGMQYARLHTSGYFDQGRFMLFGDLPTAHMFSDYNAKSQYGWILDNTELALKNDPDIAEAYMMRGMIKEAFGKQDEAYNEYQKAKKCKDFTDYQRAIVAANAANCGQIEEAEQMAKQALRSCSSAPLHYALAVVEFEKNRIKESEKEMDKALSLEIWIPEANYAYAEILSKMGNRKKAKEYKAFIRELTPMEPVYESTITNEISKPHDPTQRLNE